MRTYHLTLTDSDSTLLVEFTIDALDPCDPVRGSGIGLREPGVSVVMLLVGPRAPPDKEPAYTYPLDEFDAADLVAEINRNIRIS